MSNRWKTIASAPKDGTPALCYSPGRVTADHPVAKRQQIRVDKYSSKYGRFRGELPESPYTHWQPLPPAPDSGDGWMETLDEQLAELREQLAELRRREG